MTQSFDMAELLALAKDNSPESRSRLFGLMGDLFLNKGGYLSTEERTNLSEILSALLPQADKESRLKLAYDLSGSTAVPRELARRIGEDEIDVASPVLFKSTKLTDQDLIDLAARSPEHAAVIATRRGLSMHVADALMRSGQTDVVQALLDNASSQISTAALHTALEMAKTSEELQDSISRRVELPEEVAAELMEWAGDRVRERLMDRFNILMVEIVPPSEAEEELPPLDVTQFNKANGIIAEPEPDLADMPPTGFARYGAATSTAPIGLSEAMSAVSKAAAQPRQAEAEAEARLDEDRLAEAEATRAKAKKDLVAKTLAALAHDSHPEPQAEAKVEPQAEPHVEPAMPVAEEPAAAAPVVEEEPVAHETPPSVRRDLAAERLTFQPVDMELELIDVGDSGEVPPLAEPMAQTERESAASALAMDLELELEQAPPAAEDAPAEAAPTEVVPTEIAVAEAAPAELPAAEAAPVEDALAEEMPAAEISPAEAEPAKAAPTPTEAVSMPEAAAIAEAVAMEPAPAVEAEPIAEAEPVAEAEPLAEPESFAEPESLAEPEPVAEPEPEPVAAPAMEEVAAEASAIEHEVEAPAPQDIAEEPAAEPAAEVPTEQPVEAPIEEPAEPPVEVAAEMAVEQPAPEPPAAEETPPPISDPRKEALVAKFIKSALAAAAKAMPSAPVQPPASESLAAEPPVAEPPTAEPSPAAQPTPPISEEAAAEPAEAIPEPVAEQPETVSEPEAPLPDAVPEMETAAAPEPEIEPEIEPEAPPEPEPVSEPVTPAAARAPLPAGAEHKLTTTLVIAMLNNGGLARAEAMFAQMTGLRIGLVRRLAAESGGEGLAMAARAIHMSREDFSTIYLLWRKLKSRDGFVPTSDHGKALDFFDSAPQDRVMSVMNRWRKDPEKLFASA